MDPSALPERSLVISFSGTEREDWKKQLLVLGVGVFALGVVLGNVTKSASKPEPRVRLSRLPAAQRDALVEARVRRILRERDR